MASRRICALVLAVVGMVRGTPAADASLPPEAEAVKRYILEKEYPEVFDGTHYRVRIKNIVVADVDNDGYKEVVLGVDPHYRQSATIQIFKVSADYTVTRLREGLAPGPLVPLTGNYLDSHTLGQAIDLTIGKGRDDPKVRAVVVETAFKQFGGVVAYSTFFHADGRAGLGFYVDMSDVDVPQGEDSCRDFEFSAIRDIAVGHLAGQQKNVLAAWVGEDVWVYLIEKVRADGYLDKKRWIVKAPEGFTGFLPGKGLSFMERSGKQETLQVDTSK